MGRGEVLSLGSINVDVEGRLAEWPPLGASVLATDFLLAGGGKAANAALLAGRLGASVRLIGHVGDDGLREIALDRLRSSGVDLSNVQTVVGSATGVAWVAVFPNGDKGIVAFSNANARWTDADADAAVAVVAGAPAGSVLVADVEIPDFVVERAARAAGRRGIPFVLDPSRPERVTPALLRLADYVTPDSHEARLLTGVAVDSVEAAARAGRALVERGVGTALVKLPFGGSVVVTADAAEHIPVPPGRPIDTTGAGDAFAGAFAVALAEGWPAPEAARWGVAAASLAIQTYGAQPAYPDRFALAKFLATLEPSHADRADSAFE